MMKKRNFILSFFLLLLGTLFAFAACGGEKTKELRINVPENTVLEAELGAYDIPKYDVVDSDGLIMAGYLVEVESVVGPDGKEVPVSYGKINVSVPGIYVITYSASGEGVKNASLKVDFGDRIPPTVNMDEDALPKFYISGFTYSLPQYTISDGPDMSKCWVKVYYKANSDSERVEVAVENSRFEVEHNSGKYIIVIHVEDAAGNKKDNEYEVEATGPSEIVGGKILYSDEKFGVSQVKTLWNNFQLSYSTEKAYDNEAGALKVTVPSTGGDYIILDRIIESDVSKYTHLVIRIYNDNDHEVYSGYCWFGDITLAPNAWTELKIPVGDLDTKNVTHPAVAGIVINSENITNLSLRLFDDYEKNTVEGGSTFYLSAMYAVTEAPSEPEMVVDDKIAYFDEAFGVEQVSLYWPAPHKLSYDTSVSYESENGSLKVEFLSVQADNYVILDTPWIKDVSAYDYLVFRVYNPTKHTFSMGTTWAADTEIAAEGWTEVKIPVNLFGAAGSITDMSGAKLSATDISKLPLRIFGAGSFAAGECFYISSVFGGKAAEPIEKNVVLNFDKASALDRVTLHWGDPNKLSYDTSVKYEGEDGSLKVEFLSVQADNYVILNTPCIKDVSAYDYLVFRVYNPTKHTFSMGTTWAADTEIAAEGWTEVKIPVNLFGAAGSITDMSGAKLSATDISKLPLRIFGAGSFAIGECFYISAVYGINEIAEK